METTLPAWPLGPGLHQQIAKTATAHPSIGPAPTATLPGLGVRSARPEGGSPVPRFLIPRAVE